MPISFHGLPAAPGIGIGTLFIYRSLHLGAEAPTVEHVADPTQEWARLLLVTAHVDQELAVLSGTENSLVAEVFSAQRAILQDQTLLQALQKAIVEEGQSALSATHQVIYDLIQLFRNLGDEYFAGRAIDILDIGQRLLTHLGAPQANRQRLQTLPPQSILVATDLTPSELTDLAFSPVVGIALAESTPTAHSAILARSMGIPMVCGVGGAILTVPAASAAVLDGNAGKLVLLPSATELADYQAAQARQVAVHAAAVAHAQEPAQTQDGIRIPILANANQPDEVALAKIAGADGVGLLRTEYLFQHRAAPPTLEEQYAIYLALASQLRGAQFTVRALDAGGDKPVRYLHHAHEENPFLGLRGLRLLLAEPQLLQTQFRALYQVAVALQGDVSVRFMLPMVSSVEEVHAVQQLLATVMAEEGASDHLVKPLPIGVMIEVPSAALTARPIAALVDFLSIGTNDLAQYTLATDRTNANVAALADPLHPAVLQLIELTCQAGAAAGIPVSICGEVSGDLAALPLLLGLGLTEISAPLPAVPLIKAGVRQLQMADCRALALRALGCGSAQAVRDLLGDRTAMLAESGNS